MPFKYKFFSLIILFSISVFSCKKRPYSTAIAGWVITRADTTAVSYAVVKLAHWDGSQSSDTDFIKNSTADTNGWFSFVVETENNNDYFWMLAQKQGFKNSSWETVNGGFSNTVTIKMDTIGEK